MVAIIFRIFVATHVYAQHHVGVPRLKTLPSLPIPVAEFVRETTRIARKYSISVHFQTWQNTRARRSRNTPMLGMGRMWLTLVGLGSLAGCSAVAADTVAVDL